MIQPSNHQCIMGPSTNRPLSVCAFLSTLLVQFLWNYTLSIYFIHAALFSCCTIWVLHFSHVALFSYWIFFYSFSVAISSCCTLSMLHFFRITLFFFFVISLTFHVFFMRCTFFLCFTFFALHCFCVALCSCYILFMLHFFQCTHFHVALFSCWNFIVLHSFSVVLSSFCTLFILQLFRIALFLTFHYLFNFLCVLSYFDFLNKQYRHIIWMVVKWGETKVLLLLLLKNNMSQNSLNF